MPMLTPNFSMVLDAIMITILLGSTQLIHPNTKIYARTSTPQKILPQTT